MADEVSTTVPTDASAPAAAVSDASATTVPETNGDSAIPKADEDLAGKQATTEATAPDGEKAEVAVAPSATDADPASSAAKKEKRKSTSGVPEHKSKSLKKKKSMPTLHLDCKPGDYYWARLKGHQPWPAIICDEQMLPEMLLGTRPVSTTRPDGSLREDFKEGGKNAKERTYAVMFLQTNEFSWIANTALTPLDPEECKGSPKAKMTKQLAAAYKLAAEQHDIDYFKTLLKQWQDDEKKIEEEMRALEAEEDRQLADEAAAAAAEEKGVEKKKKSRKSKGVDEDVVMEGGEAPKSSKKRKKEAESEAEGGKPKKTPKVTKLNVSKTPNGEASAKKSKKKVVKPVEDEIEQQPQMNEADRLAALEKQVLYLRHRLQKGFLSRDQAPQESEMSAMDEFFTQVESHENLEASILKQTKIHKVLKGIVKLSSIPKDDEFNFKKRSAAMLAIWNMRMDAADTEAPASAADAKFEAPETKTNGEAATLVSEAGEPKIESEAKEEVEKAAETADQIDTKIETSAVADEEITKPTEEPAAEEAAALTAGDVDQQGDTSMPNAPEAAANDGA